MWKSRWRYTMQYFLADSAEGLFCNIAGVDVNPKWLPLRGQLAPRDVWVCSLERMVQVGLGRSRLYYIFGRHIAVVHTLVGTRRCTVKKNCDEKTAKLYHGVPRSEKVVRSVASVTCKVFGTERTKFLGHIIGATRSGVVSILLLIIFDWCKQ